MEETAMATARKGSELYLRNGDCMLRSEFHRRYSEMPEGYRAELIKGIVFEPPSPVSYWHGDYHAQLIFLLKTYAMQTPNVGLADNSSVFLSEEDEVQPDLMLRLLQDAGGNSRLTDKGFVDGAPELVAEIAYSSRAIDLHLKKDRYQLAGVAEYIVVCIEPKEFYWFDLAKDEQLNKGRKVTRSKVFPGLWLSASEILKQDDRAALRTLNMGLQSKEHRDYVDSMNTSP